MMISKQKIKNVANSATQVFHRLKGNFLGDSILIMTKGHYQN